MTVIFVGNAAKSAHADTPSAQCADGVEIVYAT